MIRPPGGAMKHRVGDAVRCGVCVMRPQGAAMIPSRVSDDTISCDTGKILT